MIIRIVGPVRGFGRGLKACRSLQWVQNRQRSDLTINGRTYQTDSWTNVPDTILASVSRRLHLQPGHPLATTRKLIESHFPNATNFNDLLPVVSVQQNFDSLGFPTDHPGRSKTDTYYVNKDTVLRTHTSAHQADVFREKHDSFLISADVYRRDAIDRSHYPVFHQMEGARLWDSSSVGGISAELSTMGSPVADDPTVFHSGNPVQSSHTDAEAAAISAHLKRSLELVVADIFARAQVKPVQMRWIEAYFPFTSPSFELEVFWNGEWLELLGCGVIKQELLDNAGIPEKRGWAFGVGLERLAMLLFGIDDIRLFWSRDERFLGMFQPGEIKRFVPFSKFPPCYKDVSFWLPGEFSKSDEGASAITNSAGGKGVHENDIMEVVREAAGPIVEDVKLIDEFTHPKTSRTSLCYRINYRSLERTLTNEEVNNVQARVRERLVQQLNVELR